MAQAEAQSGTEVLAWPAPGLRAASVWTRAVRLRVVALSVVLLPVRATPGECNRHRACLIAQFCSREPSRSLKAAWFGCVPVFLPSWAQPGAAVGGDSTVLEMHPELTAHHKTLFPPC